MASIPSSPFPEADGEPAPGDVIPPKWSTPGPVGDPESRQAERLAREYGREPRRALSCMLSDTALNVLSDQTAPRSISAAQPRFAELQSESEATSGSESEVAASTSPAASSAIPPAALAAAQSRLHAVNEEAAACSRRGGDRGRMVEPERTAAGDDELDDDEMVAEGGHCDITQESLIDLQHWGKWITAICVVGFDLELGQTLERIFPAGMALEADDIKHISFLSFPDSNTGCTGDTTFSFRIRCHTGRLPRFSTTTHRKQYLFGSVYFRQVPDASNRRGYYQKSVVILSEHPYSAVFAKIGKVVAKAFFERGAAAIESACHDIHDWPDQQPGESMVLPLLRHRLQVSIPANVSSIQFSPQAAGLHGGKQLVASAFTWNLYRYLKTLLPSLQLLWELMITAEPVIVRGSTPATTSSTVLSLVSLTAPLTYMGDYRPYFTIHDTDCQLYVKHSDRHPCAILGVTNPYFDRALATWPTTIRLIESSRSKLIRKGDSLDPKSASTGRLLGGSPSSPTRKDKRAGLQTKCRQVLDHDRKFLKEVLNATGEDSSTLTMRIRSHFWELTQQFMIPLESYAARLMPLKSSISPFRAIPQLGEFDPKAFLDTVKGMGGTLTAISGFARPAGRPEMRRGNWNVLYKRFLASPNFVGWLSDKKRTANAEILRLYLCVMKEADFTIWATKRSEVEVMDLFLRGKEALVEAEKTKTIDSELTACCWIKVAELTSSLPQDVRQSLAMSPIGKLARSRSGGKMGGDGGGD